MKKSERSLLVNVLVLAAVLAGLSAYYVFWKIPRARIAEQRGKIFLFDGKTVSSVEALEFTLRVTNGLPGDPATRRMSLERKPDGWMLATPWREPADPESIQQALNDLVVLKSESVLTDTAGEMTNRLGFSEPAWTATVTWDGGSRTGLAVGAFTSDGRFAYVMRSGDPAVYLVYAYKFQSLVRPPEEYRNRDVFDVRPEDIGDLAITTSAGVNFHVRTLLPGPGFELIRPERQPPGRLDPVAVKSLLIDLTGLQVSSFKQDSFPVRGVASVRLTTQSGQVREIRIGSTNAEGEYAVRIVHRRASAWVAAENLTNVLDLKVSDLMPRREAP